MIRLLSIFVILAGLAMPAFAQPYDATAISGKWATPGADCGGRQGLFAMETRRTTPDGVPAMHTTYIRSDDPMQWAFNDVGYVPTEGEDADYFFNDYGKTDIRFVYADGKATLVSADSSTPTGLTRCPGTQVDFAAEDATYQQLTEYVSGGWYEVDDPQDQDEASTCQQQTKIADGLIATGTYYFQPVDNPVFFDEEPDLRVGEVGSFDLTFEREARWRLDIEQGQQVAALVFDDGPLIGRADSEFRVFFQQRPMNGKAQPVMSLRELAGRSHVSFAKCEF